MARPGSPHLTDQNSTVRQLKLLVLVLIVSNIGLGAFSFYLLRTMDRSYTELFERSVPVLNDLQTLTAKAMTAMRGTNAASIAHQPAPPPIFIDQGRASFLADRVLREKLIKTQWLSGSENEKAEFRAAGEAFSQVGDEVMVALAAGRWSDAAKVREGRLRAAFDRYIAATTKLADFVEAASERANDAVSARTGSLSNVVLGIASWPVLLLAGLLALTAIFVLVLMVLFRGREMSDMP